MNHGYASILVTCLTVIIVLVSQPVAADSVKPFAPNDPVPGHTDTVHTDDSKITLKVTVNHPERQGLDVMFYNEDGNNIGNDRVMPGETATTTRIYSDNGAHKWYAVAKDDGGDRARSDTFMFTLRDGKISSSARYLPGSPTNVSPIHGETVKTNKGYVNLSVHVNHIRSYPMKVRFFNNKTGNKIGETGWVESGERASIKWRNISNGNHTWYAEAMGLKYLKKSSQPSMFIKKPTDKSKEQVETQPVETSNSEQVVSASDSQNQTNNETTPDKQTNTSTNSSNETTKSMEELREINESVDDMDSLRNFSWYTQLKSMFG